MSACRHRTEPARWLWAALLCASLLTAGMFVGPASTARAEHTAERRDTDRTAYTLRHGELRLGLWQMGVGLFDQLELTTYPPIWLLTASKAIFTPSAHLKWMFLDLKGWAASFRVGGYYLMGNNTFSSDENALDSDQFRALALPFDLAISWRHNERFTTSLQTTLTHVITKGEVDLAETEIRGETVTDNVHLAGTFEWRVTKTLALQAVGKYLPYRANMVVKAETRLDELTSAIFEAGIDTSRLEHTGAGELVAAFSRGKLELRAGVGVGAYFLDGIGAVLIRPTPYPVFDIYYRH